jgi:AraC-like DNA-binding protein
MLFYLSLSGIILSVILFFRSARIYRSSVYLAGLFFLVSLYSLIVYILFYSKSVLLVSIVYINITSVTFLIGPMIYWYTRSILSDNHRLSKTDLLHLLPTVIFLATSLPYIFSPYEEKLGIAEELVRRIEFMGSYKPTLLYRLIPAEVIFLSRSVLVLIYALGSVWMLFRYIRAGKRDLVLSGQRYMTRWLGILLAFLIILAVSHSLFVLEVVTERSSRLFYSVNFMQVFSAIGLAGLFVVPHFFPSILYGLPLIAINPAEDMIGGNGKKAADNEGVKMKGLVFETEYINQIKEKISATFTDKKPYLEKNFNLAQLSVLTQIPVHHLAYFFREHLHQSFHDYRNKWRIEYAKELIKKGKAKKLTLEAIGTLSGFSSRNTFFIAFKRAEGISPSEYASQSGAMS